METWKAEMILYGIARGIIEAIAGTYPLPNEISILFRDTVNHCYYIWGIDPDTGRDYFNKVETKEAIVYLRTQKSWCISTQVKKYFPFLKKGIV